MGTQVHLSAGNRSSQLFDAVRWAPLGQFIGKVLGMVEGDHLKPKNTFFTILKHLTWDRVALEMGSFILVTGVQSYWDRYGASAFWLNAIELLFSEGDYSHSLGENIEKCLIDVYLWPSRGGQKINIFSVLLPTLCLHCDLVEGGWCVSG